jgi:hypothetical protein
MKSTRPSSPAATPSKRLLRPPTRPSRQPVPFRTGAKPEATGATAALETQIAGLREIGDLLRRQLDEVREDRERWRSQAEAVQRLITSSEERTRRSQTEAGRDHRPWWHQFAGLEGIKLIILLGSILLMVGIIADKLK